MNRYRIDLIAGDKHTTAFVDLHGPELDTVRRVVAALTEATGAGPLVHFRPATRLDDECEPGLRGVAL